MKADLHIHTTASDGTWDPAQLVQAVQQAGLQAFAVTDHDCITNVAPTAALAEAAGLRLIPGVELNATKDNHNYHILGYGIDVNNRALQELCHYNTQLLETKDTDTIAILQSQGWPVDITEFKSYTYDRHRGGFRSLAYLLDKGCCTDVMDFFQKVFTPENNLGFPEFPSFAQVISTIHGAGGLALCAHVASDFHGAGLQECLPRLVQEQLDGFECYHSGHSPENSRLLAHYCKRHGLCISGGSDCHGTFVATRHLGVPAITTAELNLPGLL